MDTKFVEEYNNFAMLLPPRAKLKCKLNGVDGIPVLKYSETFSIFFEVFLFARYNLDTMLSSLSWRVCASRNLNSLKVYNFTNDLF